MSRAQELRERYASAMHAVQSGVATEIELGISSGTSPKHLRVGINSAMVDTGALATLLVKKGVITEEEHLEALAESAEREKASYEERLTERLGRPVTLV
jgi:hypothetical protein